MKKTLIAGIALTAAVVAIAAIWLQAPAAAVGTTSDHALIDQTSGDVSVRCRTTNGQPFIVYGAFRAIGGT